MKLTFKQYLEGKDQLRHAINNVPTTIVEYEVCKYCSLYVGESKEESTLVTLKPKQKVVVKWRYDSAEKPSPEHISFIGINTLSEDNHQVFWTGEKLHKWLMRHTKESKQP